MPSPKRILVIRPGGIGDAVHLLSAIKVLRNYFPEAVIDILAEKRNSAVFSLTRDIGTVFRYNNLSELRRIFKGHYDLVVDTEQWHRLSAVVARLTNAPMIVGYATNDRKKLFTHTVRYRHDCYEADSFVALLEGLGINLPHSSSVPPLFIPEVAHERAAALLGALIDRPFVAVFPGASIPERRWSGDKFGAVSKKLHARGISTVVVGGSDDWATGNRIIAGACGLNLAGRTSIPETAAIIQRARLLVSGDSGILHIAVGLGTPTVSLFGPGIAKKWAPRGDHHVVINKCLPCSPCTRFGTTPRCPINARCMSDISVSEVVAAVDKLLEETASESGFNDSNGNEKQFP